MKKSRGLGDSIEKITKKTGVKTMVDGKLVCEAVLSFVIGTANDTKSNPYLSKRQQYYHTILPENFKNDI